MFDGGGVYRFVTPQGGKIWRLAYRFEGKPKTMSFDPYPEVSLAAARAKQDEAKTLLRDKINPMAERQPVAANTKTLQEASETYWSGRADLTDGYRKNAQRGWLATERLQSNVLLFLIGSLPQSS